MKNDKLDMLVKMLDEGGESYRKAKNLMGISVKYEFALSSCCGKKF